MHWTEKASVQAALAGGVFVFMAAIAVPVIDRVFPKQESGLNKELAIAIANLQKAQKTEPEKAEKEYQETLMLIVDFSKELCTPPSTQGVSKEISYEGTASIKGLAKELKGLELQGDVTIKQKEWQGVLQQDLANELENSKECRVQVINTLKEQLLANES